jgi:quinol monooxygenase YgiN
MIIIAGTIRIDPDQRAAALAAGESHVRAARRQPGCLAYDWSADPYEDDKITVHELWRDAESLRAHFAGDAYRLMRETIGAHGLRGADVEKYEIARRGPVYDATGTATPDFD